MSSPYYTIQLRNLVRSKDFCRQAIQLWEKGDDTMTMYRKALDSGQFSTMTARSLKNVIVDIFAPRFIEPEAEPWAQLIKDHLDTWPLSLIEQMIFLQTARGYLIIREFLEQEYWPRTEAAQVAITSDVAIDFILRGSAQGKTQKPWRPEVAKRHAGSVTGVLNDFGLLSGNGKGVFTIEDYRLDWRLFLLMVCHFKETGLSDNAIINHRDWQIFGLTADDVTNMFSIAELRPYFLVQKAGNAAAITWKLNTLQEAADVIA